MARGINTGSHPGRQVSRGRFVAADPAPPEPPPYTLPSFPSAAILAPLADPNAPDGTEQQVWENLVDYGIPKPEATQLTHQMPAYKWYEHEQSNQLQAQWESQHPTGVGAGGGGGASSSTAPAPPTLPEHYGNFPSQVTQIINSTRHETPS